MEWMQRPLRYLVLVTIALSGWILTSNFSRGSDLTTDSDEILHTAALLAGRSAAKLHVVHAFDFQLHAGKTTPAGGFPARLRARPIARSMNRSAARYQPAVRWRAVRWPSTSRTRRSWIVPLR